MEILDGRIVDWSRDHASAVMREMLPRWDHVKAVARLAEVVGSALGSERDLLVAAALLHDVGYSPDLAVTGFHPLDGARHVRALGHEHLACLVAHHSGARHEATLRGYRDYEDEFPASEQDQ
jgi:putative nucleotidyltransferase with HDIG domain